jgi:hypothetical protein
MRRIMFGAGAALACGAAALYVLPRSSPPAPPSVILVEAEEQEPRVMPPSPESVEMPVEPIVVEQPEFEGEFKELLDALKQRYTASMLENAASGSEGRTAPRPDAEGTRRMPYADETPLPPVVEVPGATEEAEVKEAPASGPEPPLVEYDPLPAMDYHHHHPSCPYTGRCPAPYPRR